MLLLLAVVTLLFPVWAISAAEQFGLRPDRQPSACFLDCNKQATGIFKHPARGENSPASNSVVAITINCKEQQWVDLIGVCLVSRCISGPDVAYAVEYGVSFCKRAGVHVQFELPVSYLEQPGGQYYLSTLQPRAESSAAKVVPAAVGAAVAAGLAVYLA